jgi:hypothetical protein
MLRAKPTLRICIIIELPDVWNFFFILTPLLEIPSLSSGDFLGFGFILVALTFLVAIGDGLLRAQGTFVSLG